MDIEDFSDAVIKVDQDMNRLSDDLYGATQDKLPKIELEKLLADADQFLSGYHSLKQLLTGGKLKEVSSYDDDIERIESYLRKLKSTN